MNNTPEPDERTVTGNRCSICGLELPSHLAPNRCPQCLLRVGLAAQPAPAVPETIVVPASSLVDNALPQPGADFGHYRIVRLLGKGGMGTVFEAEDLENGRRVALKMLGHQFDSVPARNRFFREGRLAASVNHPNSVYVYGTEEIAGIPVIAMELVQGGTLQNRVSGQGSLPISEAVDDVLQIIEGLEAAQRVGILHRDIKPSNCFVEADGTVKIGDFGLSISTQIHTEPSLTITGTILGTPAFSSPEQLRGDELTVRSDIYSVGVTLYYLLTGHHPFAAGNLVQLLATVLEQRPKSPAQWCPRMPHGLSRAVLRCLEKNPEKRFRNYDELRAALLPYKSTAPTPATLGLRALAFIVDGLLLSSALQLATWLFNSPDRAAGREIHDQSQFLPFQLGQWVFIAAYFGVLEGRWGASVGKAICRLRVARLDCTPPGPPLAMLRAMIFTGVRRVPDLLLFNSLWWKVTSSAHWPVLLLAPLVSLAMTALIFSTARRRNGFAGWHDLASGTRVILKTSYQARPVLPRSDEALPNLAASSLVGPYHVLGRIGGTENAEILLGFDARLLRRVWIRRSPPGTPPVPPGLRNLGRPGRLRWLNGARTATESWDAYDVVAGKPLLSLVAEKQCWSRVRYWLFDLAKELIDAQKDGSLPDILALDRVWITEDGRAKLLDFPAPGTETTGSPEAMNPPAPSSAPEFLRGLARSALEGRAIGLVTSPTPFLHVPVALQARHFLHALNSDSDLSDALASLQPLLSRPAAVSRARRLVLLGACAALPLIIAALNVAEFQIRAWSLQTRPELASLQRSFEEYEMLQRRVRTGDELVIPVSRAVETCIAARFAQANTNQGLWHSLQMKTVVYAERRQQAEDMLQSRKVPSPEVLAEAEAVVNRFFSQPQEKSALASFLRANLLTIMARAGYLPGLAFVVIPCLVGSLLFCGGALTRSLGIAFVTRDGALASRWRVTGRNLVAWLPFLLLPIPARWLAPAVGDMGGFLMAEIACVILALLLGLLPQRGLPDRITGTWLVPV